MEFDRVLRIFGLKDRKAAVFMAALELGRSTGAVIARAAGLKRTTTHMILEDLQIQGLVIYEEVNGKRLWQVVNPRRLKQIVDQHQREVAQALPEFLALYKPSKEKPTVSYYEGKDELETIYAQILQAPFVCAYGNFDKIIQYYPEFPKYLQKYTKRDVKIKDLTLKSPLSLEYAKLYTPPKHQLKFLPPDMHIDTDKVIFGPDRMALISYDETIHGMIIQSRALVETEQLVFDRLWKLADE